MAQCGQAGEAQVGHRHEHETQQYGSLHAETCVEHASNEHAGKIGPEAEADVVQRDLIVGVLLVVEQQSEREIRQRVADLVQQHEEQHEQRPAPPEELEQRRSDGVHDCAQALLARRSAMSRRLAESQTHDHGWNGIQGADDVRELPTAARGNHERQRRRRYGPDAPTVLRHAGPDTELSRLERLDAIRVDHDVVSRASDGHQDGCDCRCGETLLRID
jgi:hypothetical protein